MSGRAGLIPKKIRVRGKNGTHERTYWVRPSGSNIEQLNRLAEAKKARKWTDEPPAGMPKQTIDKYYDGHPNMGGKVKDPSRAKLHDAIKSEFLSSVLPVKPGEKKIAIMTMGAPASGKGGAKKGLPKDGFVDIDPDEIKGKLPEYKISMDPDKTYRGAAAMVHEESSALAKELQADAISQGKNVIVDGTGANAENYIKKMMALKKAGYQVNIVMPHIEVEEGMTRMKSRAEGSGRYVPDSLVREAYDKIPKNVQKIMAMSDTFKLMDNLNGARLVMEKKADGSIIVHDQKYMDDFYRKNPQNK